MVNFSIVIHIRGPRIWNKQKPEPLSTLNQNCSSLRSEVAHSVSAARKDDTQAADSRVSDIS